MNKVAPMDYDSSALSILTPAHYALPRPPIPQNRTCKICLEEEVATMCILNPDQAQGLQLLMPCECSGSVGFVHEKCLKTWICKQLENTGKKQAYCEICKSQIYFKLRKTRYCELGWQHLTLISGCNILSAVVELFLLVVVGLIFRYSLGLHNSTLLRAVLLVIVCILALAFCFTFALMVIEAFIKTKKEIAHIFSIQEAEELGLREVRIKTSHQLAKSTNTLGRSSFRLNEKLKINGNGNRVANTHHLLARKPSNARLVETSLNHPFGGL